MMRSLRYALLLAAVGSAALGVIFRTPLSGVISAAQDSQPAPTFRSEADLVVVHVNVFDRRSDAVPGLPQSAFLVFEEDKPQDISFFNNVDVPVAVGLVVDNSGSMIARRSMVLAGGDAFVTTSHPDDELFAVVFNEHVRFGLPPGAPFTRSRIQLAAALGRYPAGGLTAIYDAVIEALDHLKTAPHQKRVLVVLSDGEDNASRRTKDEMLARAAASDAIVYTVSTSTGRQGSDGDPAVLKKLAEISGGVAYFPASDQEAVRSFQEIAGNIRRGYSLGYVPTSTDHDGRFRRVKVTVQVPGRSGLSVRTRRGYEATEHASVR